MEVNSTEEMEKLNTLKAQKYRNVVLKTREFLFWSLAPGTDSTIQKLNCKSVLSQAYTVFLRNDYRYNRPIDNFLDLYLGREIYEM